MHLLLWQCHVLLYQHQTPLVSPLIHQEAWFPQIPVVEELDKPHGDPGTSGILSPDTTTIHTSSWHTVNKCPGLL